MCICPWTTIAALGKTMRRRLMTTASRSSSYAARKRVRICVYTRNSLMPMRLIYLISGSITSRINIKNEDLYSSKLSPRFHGKPSLFPAIIVRAERDLGIPQHAIRPAYNIAQTLRHIHHVVSTHTAVQQWQDVSGSR